MDASPPQDISCISLLKKSAVFSLALLAEFRGNRPAIRESTALQGFDRMDLAAVVFRQKNAGAIGPVGKYEAFSIRGKSCETLAEFLFGHLQEFGNGRNFTASGADDSRPAATGSATATIKYFFRHDALQVELLIDNFGNGLAANFHGMAVRHG